MHFVLLTNLFLTPEIKIGAFSLSKRFFCKVITLIQIHIGTVIDLASAGFGFGYAHRERSLRVFMDESVNASQ